MLGGEPQEGNQKRLAAKEGDLGIKWKQHPRLMWKALELQENGPPSGDMVELGAGAVEDADGSLPWLRF